MTFTLCGPEGRWGGKLGQADFEKTVLVGGAQARRIDGDREAQPSFERSDLHLHRMVVPFPLAQRGPLAGDGDHPFSELDCEVLRLHAGDVHVDDDGVGRFVDVGGGLPLGGRDEAHRPAVGDLVEIDLQLVGQMHGVGARAGGAMGAAVSHKAGR